ncbi:MAG: RNA-binding protein, partial [Nitratireductor sp.]|nr:RNA-binding protein [Nitratireductor sp.]
ANAGAVQLLDDSYRRRLVGLVSGEAGDLSQPLLSPLYYISRALAPFSDLRESSDANIGTAVPQLLAQGVSAIVLADIGTIPADTADALGAWIEKGGMLIRFAGPRLAA